MKIEELPSGSYRVRKKHKNKVYTAVFNHKPSDKEAMIVIAEKMQEDNRGENGTFEEFANRYIYSREGVASPSTPRTYEIKLNQLSDEFRKTNLYEITAESVQLEVKRLSQKYEPKTVKTTHGFISSVLKAYRPRLVLTTKLPQSIKKEKYEPNNRDIKRILEEVKNTRYDVPFQLGVWGMRVGEICALTIDDLDGNNLRIYRDLELGKGNKWVLKENPKSDDSNRILPLTKELADKIREQGYIYEGHPNSLNKAIHRIQKKLDIPPFTFHDLRHYFASYAHSLKIPDADIMAIGGWKTDIVMKRIYRKAIEESKMQSVKKIAKKLYN